MPKKMMKNNQRTNFHTYSTSQTTVFTALCKPFKILGRHNLHEQKEAEMTKMKQFIFSNKAMQNGEKLAAFTHQLKAVCIVNMFTTSEELIKLLTIILPFRS